MWGRRTILGALVALAVMPMTSCASHHERDDAGSFADACVLCDCPAPGLYRSIPFVTAGTTRGLLLYVPSGYRCDGDPGTLWIDLHHGRQQFADLHSDHPEEDEVDELVARAEREGVVLLRPRAGLHPRGPGGSEEVFGWVEPTSGDTLPEEVAFLEAVVPYVQTATRTTAALLLTGVELPHGVATPLLASHTLRLDGIAGFGSWLVRLDTPLPADPALAPGARAWGDTHSTARGALVDQLDRLGAAFGPDAVRVLETPLDWRVPWWEYDDALAWLLRGEAPHASPPPPPWRTVAFPANDVSLYSLTERNDGTLVATGTDERVFGEDPSEGWVELPPVVPNASRRSLVDACALPSGDIVALDYGLAVSHDGRVFAHDPDETRRSVTPWGLACGLRGEVLTAEFDMSSVTGDAGRSWTTHSHPGSMVVAAAISPTRGSAILAGTKILRADDTSSTDWVEATLPGGERPNLYDVDCGPDGTWWAVGEGGTVLRSIDDGRTFTRLSGGTTRALYAVEGHADGSVIAVGAYGTVVVSHDGATLRAVPTDAAGFLDAVHWRRGGGATVAGEAGLVLTADAL